ncbi:cytochrome c biogenesis protein ResB [Nocardioides terrisoli]|uniref:cytochrome c biogenesis protein ResB n=1 Tax=Nocardioides terrisoli TaxID=3388267 RepID=UPI00287B9702|nr:cytochrome c biogenesis protein ResB [Nocardioides marmorisolisilvae]
MSTDEIEQIDPPSEDLGPGAASKRPPESTTGQLRALSPVELMRWTWRQLTSMRTALLLLFLVALAAIPGSVVPQENVDSVLTSQWKQQHTTLAPIYDKLGLFHVFNSVWFAAIYLLLVISLLGCIVPRLGVYWRGLRAKPPGPPRNLRRLPAHAEAVAADSSPQAVLDVAEAALRRRRFRTVRHDDAVSAERGYLREAGNLLFHLSVLLVLAGVAIGGLFGYQGGVIVVTGHGFTNSLSQYDDFKAGTFFTPSRLAPFSFTVHNFDVNFIRSGREAGMAHKFSAAMSYRTTQDGPVRRADISVNHPLTIDGTSVYLISHGYAPHITVRDGKGHVVQSGPVVFMPEDDTFRSFGVVKVPDAQARDGRPEQIGLEGEFYPTYAFTDATGPFSAFPDDKNPALSMLAYTGDLGLDSGRPQSVYSLDKAGLKPIKQANGKPLRIDLMLGHTVLLPHGMGSVTFDGVSRYVKLQVSRSPADWLALLGMVLGLTGLLGSLFIRPRRLWVRVRPADGGDGSGGDGSGVRRTLVEVAGLDRTSGGDLVGEIEALAGRLGTPPSSRAAEDGPAAPGTEEDPA